jgi:hypothetical protein
MLALKCNPSIFAFQVAGFTEVSYYAQPEMVELLKDEKVWILQIQPQSYYTAHPCTKSQKPWFIGKSIS